MTRLFKLTVLGFCSIALAGGALAEGQFTAKFRHDAALTTEANYAAFERVARKACAVDLREAGGVARKMRAESECQKVLMASAIAAIGKRDLAALHALRTGAPAELLLARGS